ncbi:hypothetical protein BCR39DRAFT_462532, partial [Naematelia encephala]
LGNLSWNTTDDVLHSAFSAYGQVTDCIVMKDRETGRSRGFGFVTFANQTEAETAINAMNEQDLDGRRVRVNMANQKPAGSDGGGQGGYNNQGGGGGYGQQQGGQYGGGNNYGGGGYGGAPANNYGAGGGAPQGNYGSGGCEWLV